MALKHAHPGEVVHLRPVGSPFPGPRSAALIKTDRFETVRLALSAGSSLPAHKVEGFITLFCIEGHVILESGAEIELREGGWLYLDRGAEHAVRAIADSSLLLNIMFD